MITKRQKELLNFITKFTAENEYAPSFNEMGEALGLESKAGIHRLVTGLDERGYIRRIPNRARCIEVIDRSNAATQEKTNKLQNTHLDSLSRMELIKIIRKLINAG